MSFTPPAAAPWPDPLAPPSPARVGDLLESYWLTLERLPDLLQRNEAILAEALTAELRRIVIELMLAMNGIAWPMGTVHLNGYLGDSQRAVLERTLVAPEPSSNAWLARAVALTVIYGWYAPQCVDRFHVPMPEATRHRVWAALCAALPDWPQSIESA